MKYAAPIAILVALVVTLALNFMLVIENRDLRHSLDSAMDDLQRSTEMIKKQNAAMADGTALMGEARILIEQCTDVVR